MKFKIHSKKQNQEVILNLWLILDHSNKRIHSLRGTTYIMGGTDVEKLAFLKSRSVQDYVNAKQFPAPDTVFIPNTFNNPLILKNLDMAVFENAIDEMDLIIQKDKGLKIPDCPLVCVTPLFIDENSNVKHAENMISILY